MGFVLMPSYPGAWRVGIDQDLHESLSRPIGKEGRLLAQSHKPIRNWRRGLHLAGRVVITQAKSDNLAIGQMAVKIEGLERQVGEALRQEGRLRRFEQIGAIAKALRAGFSLSKKIRLVEPSGSAVVARVAGHRDTRIVRAALNATSNIVQIDPDRAVVARFRPSPMFTLDAGRRQARRQ